MYDTILLPTDGSDGSDAVVDHALHLAELHDATLHVLHVVDTGSIPLDRHSRAAVEAMESQGEAAVEAVLERARSAGVHAVDAVRDGTPHREILDYVEAEAVDLVVMGTHGRRRARRALLGSVAERVVRLSPAPVLTVRTLPVPAR